MRAGTARGRQRERLEQLVQRFGAQKAALWQQLPDVAGLDARARPLGVRILRPEKESARDSDSDFCFLLRFK